MNQRDPKIEKCITDSNKCHQTCVETLKHCTEMGGDHATPKHLSLLRDCAEICKVNEEFMLRDSMHTKCIAEECQKICELCAQSCEEVDPNDEQMKYCAKVCRECANSCQDMLAMP